MQTLDFSTQRAILKQPLPGGWSSTGSFPRQRAFLRLYVTVIDHSFPDRGCNKYARSHSDIRHSTVDTRAIVSGVRHDVSNTHVIVSDVCRGVGTHTPSFLMFAAMFQIHVLSQTHAIVSDILQDTPKSQDGTALKDK